MIAVQGAMILPFLQSTCCRYPRGRGTGSFVRNCLLVSSGVVLALALIGTPAEAEVLTADTTWSGTVLLNEDILVPRGIILTIRPGTVVKVVQSESTKTDPEYISPLTELTVRGVLRAEGSEASPIIFKGEPAGSQGLWAGLLVDGGSVTLRYCRIHDAENGLQVFAGKAELDRSIFRGNRYGVVAHGPESRVLMNSTTISENDFGQVTLAGGEVISTGSFVTANRKRDRIDWAGPSLAKSNNSQLQTAHPLARSYGDEVLLGETVWQGRIEVSGQVRVPDGARLVILPGTIVEFKRRDTNGDGIGENGLLVQGVLVAKGTKAEPIFFRSAERQPRMGDWDAVNIMNSDGVQNLIEYCRIEDAYRGLHFHFANVLVGNSLFSNNYRGIQFQESQVEIRNNRFSRNKSAVQGRDSAVLFNGNLVQENLRGVNFYRTSLTLTENRFSRNSFDGLRLRDSGAVVERNVFDANRYGLMAQDSIYGRYAENVVAGNAELGFSLKNLDNLEVSGNFVTANGVNGMSVQDVRALIKGNSFTDNGERGLGIISFDGAIMGNNFASNGLYAIDLEGTQDVAATGNWWGGDHPDKVIFDRLDGSGRGKVNYGAPSALPLQFNWPLKEIPVSLTWRGEIVLKASASAPSGVTLTIAPEAKVRMGNDVSLIIQGKLHAVGERGRRISFTSIATPNPGAWGEILLERATGSIADYCDFTAATWGLHSHFTDLSVLNSRFMDNYGGIRFRSGPMTISHSLFQGNEIGIRSYRGIARISENTITGNEIGIFVREKGGGLKVTRNNLAGNNGYGIRIGDFNDEDVPASDNWWGVGNPETFIFDALREKGIGYVQFGPPLALPIKTGPEE